RASVRRKNRTHAATVARDVSLHAARVPCGGVHGHAQRARPLFHPGYGRDDAQRRDDCVRALARAEIWCWTSEGTKAARANFRAGIRRARGGRGAGGISTADALARWLSFSLGFALEKRNGAARRDPDGSGDDWRGGVSTQRDARAGRRVLGQPAN